MKNSIKRAQSRAGSSFAERENFRPKVKQLKKTLLTLVALLALTTQAWATDVYVVGNGDGNWLNGVAWNPGAAENKMTEQNGVYSITFTNVDANPALQFKFAINGGWAENYGCSSTTEIILNKTISNIEDGINILFELTEPADVTISFNLSELTFMISTKGMKVGDDTPPVPLTRGTGDKINEWTFTNGMPAGNVLVTVDYFDEAAFAVDNNAPTPVALAPTANNTAKANTDDPLVEGGTVANIVEGTEELEKKQGQLLYYFDKDNPTTQLTADDLKALTADDWSEEVPTADGLAEGTVYVYYYIKGADGVGGLGQGVTHTFSDSDIHELAVTLLPEPEYNVELAENTDDADNWKAKVGTGEPGDNDVFPLTGVKKGDKVTVKYSGPRKVMGVKAAKKAEPFAANEYNEASWDGEKVVLTKKTAASEPTAVADAQTNVTWSDGWYTVSGNVTITGTVMLGADTHLILQDGAQLTINGRLNCRGGDHYSLYIYGQEAGDGKLNVSNSSAAIYGSNKSGKTIEIHGGEINATSTGSLGFYCNGIKMYGGKLTATSDAVRGIGFDSGNFDVYGGEVEATSNGDMVAIGIIGSSGLNILTVYGGKVKATGGTGDGSKAIYGSIKSGTSGIKFYFTNTEGDWGVGTTYSTATAAPANRYAKAE